MKSVVSYLVLTLFIFLTACGGNSPSTIANDPSNPPESSSSKITGFVSKGPVSGASCDLYKITAGVADQTTSLATTTSSEGGIEFEDVTYTGAALISCSGGTYTDEATGETVGSTSLSAVVTVVAGGSYVISPLTELAYRLALADAPEDLQKVLDTYNSVVAAQFGLDGVNITTEKPTDLNKEEAANDSAGTYGTVLAAISQLIKDKSEGVDLDEVLAALASDLAEDGLVDDASKNNLANAAHNFLVGDSVAAGKAEASIVDAILGKLVSVPVIGDAAARTYIYNVGAPKISFINTGGLLASCTVSPVLPRGLQLNLVNNNCEIKGSSTEVTAEKSYTITATNIVGSDTAVVQISVIANVSPTIPVGPKTLSLAELTDIETIYGDSVIDILLKPKTNGGSVITYSLHNIDELMEEKRKSRQGELEGGGGFYSSRIVLEGTTLTVNSNYVGSELFIIRASSEGVDPTEKELIITTDKKAIIVTALNHSGFYGPDYDIDTDDPLPYSAPGLVGADTLNVLDLADDYWGCSQSDEGYCELGEYTISGYDGEVSPSHNKYYITVVDATFSVVPRPIIINVDANQSKGVGEVEPVLTYTVSGGVPHRDSPLTGGLVREAGETVGSYAITQGSVVASTNYDVTFNGNIFVIKYVSTPTRLSAYGPSKAVSVSWDQHATADGYNLYYAEESFSGISNLSNYSTLDGGTLIAISPSSETLRRISNRINGEKYYFVITAIKDGIESEVSDEVTVVPSGMNDTGATFSGNNPSGNNVSCIADPDNTKNNVSTEQDCSFGRDAQAAENSLNKIGAGAAGFDFTKLKMDGTPLVDQAVNWDEGGSEGVNSRWSCVKDNHTGLIWEVKNRDGLLPEPSTLSDNIHHQNNRYRWGGKTSMGYESGGNGYYEDWTSLVDGSNAEGLCGYSNWRAPTMDELASIAHHGVSDPAIDTDYFPNSRTVTGSNGYWSASKHPFGGSASEPLYNFKYGIRSGDDNAHRYALRLVRSSN